MRNRWVIAATAIMSCAGAVPVHAAHNDGSRGDAVVSSIGSNNNTAGRDNLVGSGHVAGSGHTLSVSGSTGAQATFTARLAGLQNPGQAYGVAVDEGIMSYVRWESSQGAISALIPAENATVVLPTEPNSSGLMAGSVCAEQQGQPVQFSTPTPLGAGESISVTVTQPGTAPRQFNLTSTPTAVVLAGACS